MQTTENQKKCKTHFCCIKYRMFSPSTPQHPIFCTDEAAVLLCSGAAFRWELQLNNYNQSIVFFWIILTNPFRFKSNENTLFVHQFETMDVLSTNVTIGQIKWNLLWNENSSTMQQQWRFLEWPYLSGEPLLKKLLNIQRPFRVQMTETLYQSIVWGNLFHVFMTIVSEEHFAV